MAAVIVLAAVAALLAAFWLFFSRHFSYWKERGVVSCNPFSLTGDRGGGLPFGRPFFMLLDDVYAKYKGKERYVGFFQARRPVLVALDPEVMKTVLTKEFSSFHSRGFPKDENDPFSVNLFFLDGPRWKNLRTKLSPVFTSGKLRLMFPLMADITKDLCAVVREAAAKGDREVEMRETLVRYSTDVIGSVAFGLDCKTLTGGSNDFLAMSQEVFNRNVLFLIRFFLISVHPIFAKLMPFKRMFSRTTNFFQGLMKDTVEYREQHKVERNDFVHLMMQLRAEDQGRSVLDRVNHIEFNHDNMAAQAFLFFIAGLDNIANTVGFALHELALNPELQQSVVEDVRAAKDKHGGLTYEALRDMPLLERTVREALRMYSPVGIITREPSGALKLPDTDVEIDPTAVVWIPIWQMLHDPEYFPEPERFDPDRFTEDAKQERHAYAYLPFGEGPRFCIAERFAMLEMKLCLAGLLDQHAFSVGGRTAVPLQLDAKAGSPRPTAGFWLRVANRDREE